MIETPFDSWGVSRDSDGCETSVWVLTDANRIDYADAVNYAEAFDLPLRKRKPKAIGYESAGKALQAMRVTRSGGPRPSCVCGKCPKCAQRLRMRQRRAKLNSPANSPVMER